MTFPSLILCNIYLSKRANKMANTVKHRKMENKSLKIKEFQSSKRKIPLRSKKNTVHEISPVPKAFRSPSLRRQVLEKSLQVTVALGSTCVVQLQRHNKNDYTENSILKRNEKINGKAEDKCCNRLSVDNKITESSFRVQTLRPRKLNSSLFVSENHTCSVNKDNVAMEKNIGETANAKTEHENLCRKSDGVVPLKQRRDSILIIKNAGEVANSKTKHKNLPRKFDPVISVKPRTRSVSIKENSDGTTHAKTEHKNCHRKSDREVSLKQRRNSAFKVNNVGEIENVKTKHTKISRRSDPVISQRSRKHNVSIKTKTNISETTHSKTGSPKLLRKSAPVSLKPSIDDGLMLKNIKGIADTKTKHTNLPRKSDPIISLRSRRHNVSKRKHSETRDPKTEREKLSRRSDPVISLKPKRYSVLMEKNIPNETKKMKTKHRKLPGKSNPSILQCEFSEDIQYDDLALQPSKRRKKNKSSINRHSRKSTLKRKRWMFVELNRVNEGHEDDLFEDRNFDHFKDLFPDSSFSSPVTVATPKLEFQATPMLQRKSPRFKDCISPTEYALSRKVFEQCMYRRQRDRLFGRPKKTSIPKSSTPIAEKRKLEFKDVLVEATERQKRIQALMNREESDRDTSYFSDC